MDSATLKTERKNLAQHKAKIDICFVIISEGPKNHAIGNILIKHNT